jgi:uncharacterized membrane protein
MSKAPRSFLGSERGSVRLPTWQDLRTSLWFWPAAASVISFLIAIAVVNLSDDVDERLALWSWPGDHEAARAFLQVVAGSVITVTSLTFTLVVVALQLASQQFSPRLLREFARDRVTQWVLGILVGTFVLALTTLRQIDDDAEPPRLALALTFVMSLVSIAALLGFLGHIARILRIDTLMTAVHGEAAEVIERHYQPRDEGPADAEPHRRGRFADANTVITSDSSGFVQRVHVDKLVKEARSMDAVIVVWIRSGDHVSAGSPIASVALKSGHIDEMTKVVRQSVNLGFERTLEQDPSLGLRQLVDIAVKALSPSVNDPTTAAHAVGHLGDLLTRLQNRHLGPAVHADEDGTARVVALDRDIRYYLEVAVAQIRRYAAKEPAVLISLLRMLRDLATVAHDDEQRREVERQIGLILDTVADDTLVQDRGDIEDAAGRVHMALSGDIRGAYWDRAGETRSV